MVHSPSIAGVAPKRPKLACRFYRTQKGGEPVREWLRELPAEVRQEAER
jgi:hypothetical protein